MVVGPAVIGLLVDEVARGVVFRHVCGSWQLVHNLSWMRFFGHGDESASLGWSGSVPHPPPLRRRYLPRVGLNMCRV